MLLATWPHLRIEIALIDTQGDHNRHDPLPVIGGKGLFTAELETALREGRIDLAVHSLKDLPVEDSPGLAIVAVPERANTQDLLVSHRANRLEDLPERAVVGTSSLRRAAQILALRPDLQIKDIRGNVDTRLRKLDDPTYGYDAILLAWAGLQRLGYTNLAYAHPIPHTAVLPAPGQGALAVQARAEDPEVNSYLLVLDHGPTRVAVTAERAFLTSLGGGCSLPVGALGTVRDDQLELQAVVTSPDGRRVIRVSGSAPIESAHALGQQLAAEALDQGARELLNIGDAYPLLGQRVLVTRPAHQSANFVVALRALGANPISFPTIEIVPVEDTRPLDEAIKRINTPSPSEREGGEKYDWLILTSANGVAAFWERLERAGLDGRCLASLRIAAIGPATAAALRQRNITPNLVPEVYTAEGVLAAFDALGPITGQRFLLARADIARRALAEGLQERGAQVDEIASYRTVPVSGGALPPLADVVTFTSSSTVQGYINCLGGRSPAEVLQHSRVVCIGPITAATARELGVPVSAVAEEYTIEGLLAVLKKR